MVVVPEIFYFQEVKWMRHSKQHFHGIQAAEQSQHRKKPKMVHHLYHHQPKKNQKAGEV